MGRSILRKYSISDLGDFYSTSNRNEQLLAVIVLSHAQWTIEESEQDIGLKLRKVTRANFHCEDDNIASVDQRGDTVIHDNPNGLEIIGSVLTDIKHMDVVFREGIRLQKPRDHG